MSLLSGCALETIIKELNPSWMQWKCLPDPSPGVARTSLAIGSSGRAVCPPLCAPSSRSLGRKAAQRCRHHQYASGQEAVSREKGRKEEEAFGAFVNCSKPSRWEGTEVTCGPRPRAMVQGSRAGPARLLPQQALL